MGRGLTRSDARLRAMAAAVVLAGALLPSAPADAGPSPQRTVRVRLARTGNPNGPSGQPAVSADARIVAFTSGAWNLGQRDKNRGVRDVYAYDQGTGAISILSRGLEGAAADGPSFDPALDAAGAIAAFTSRATNLAAGDGNKAADVFVTAPGLRVRASVAADGGDANGPSREPDLSADGRWLVFTSDANNLVAGDTNRRSDVFVRDLVAGVTTLVSAAPGGAAANGDSFAPAISADGRVVSFTSRASNLVKRDRNAAADVFVVDVATQAVRIASVSSRGVRQNRSVSPPFRQVSDVSGDGRYVVFDSEASNLVRGDRNRRTDVFLRDVRRNTTRRVSLATTNQEARGDSFTPRITPDGRWVAFVSAADDLAFGDARGQDVFLRDVRRGTTAVVDIASDGRPRGRERVRQVLDAPALADDAATVAFTSSAANLVRRDRNGVSDVFLRRLEPAASGYFEGAARGRGGGLVVVLRSRDRRPGPMRCQLDDRPPSLCPLGGMLLPPLRPGRHVLVALPGAPGAFYAKRPLVLRFFMRKNGKVVVRARQPSRP